MHTNNNTRRLSERWHHLTEDARRYEMCICAEHSLQAQERHAEDYMKRLRLGEWFQKYKKSGTSNYMAHERKDAAVIEHHAVYKVDHVANATHEAARLHNHADSLLVTGA